MSKRVLIKWGTVIVFFLAVSFLMFPYPQFILFTGILYPLYIFVLAGNIFLLPIIPLTIIAAESDRIRLKRFIPLSLPVLSTAFLCRIMFLLDITLTDLSRISFKNIMLFVAAIISLFIPAMLLDEIGTNTWVKRTGKPRPTLKKCAAAWGVSAACTAGMIAFSLAVVVICDDGMMLDEKRTEKEISDRKKAAYESIVELYSEDIAAIAEYSVENDISDWEFCDDASLEENWRRLFEKYGCSNRIDIDGGNVSFSFDNYNVHICYDTENNSITNQG